ncbi:hypothetical protein AM587_10016796 [Phytophthora nicotianae]|uniref:Uncharacterized protein n=1 Tax=Phytophthora nicotianae TaxID=4792 RepID=A0A0W8C6A5_PHYNI|nr:hypothetical protein AM587_10016796 [Phytophthora nicotianae]
MWKRSLLSLIASNAVMSLEIVVGLQEFQGQAASFSGADYADDYAVMSCARTGVAAGTTCAGKCAAVWRDGDEIGDDMSRTRQVVRIANQCANNIDGDLILTQNAFQKLSDANSNRVPIRWRCIDCLASNDGSAGSSDVGMALSMVFGGDLSLGELEYSGYADTDTPQDEIAAMENNNGNDKSTSVSESDASTGANVSEGNNIDGSDNSSNKIWSGSESNGQTQKVALTSPPTGPIPSYTQSPSASSTPMPATAVSSFDGASWSVPLTSAPSSSESSTSVFPPATTSPATGSSIGMVEIPDDETPHEDVDAHSTSLDSSRSTSITITNEKNLSTVSPLPSPTQSSRGSADGGSRDGVASPTSAVLKSPFFYASIVLGIAGSMGVIVGCRAKRKRKQHNETGTVSASRHLAMSPMYGYSQPESCPVDAQIRCSSHSIIVL